MITVVVIVGMSVSPSFACSGDVIRWGIKRRDGRGKGNVIEYMALTWFNKGSAGAHTG